MIVKNSHRKFLIFCVLKLLITFWRQKLAPETLKCERNCKAFFEPSFSLVPLQEMFLKSCNLNFICWIWSILDWKCRLWVWAYSSITLNSFLFWISVRIFGRNICQNRTRIVLPRSEWVPIREPIVRFFLTRSPVRQEATPAQLNVIKRDPSARRL